MNCINNDCVNNYNSFSNSEKLKELDKENNSKFNNIDRKKILKYNNLEILNDFQKCKGNLNLLKNIFYEKKNINKNDKNLEKNSNNIKHLIKNTILNIDKINIESYEKNRSFSAICNNSRFSIDISCKKFDKDINKIKHNNNNNSKVSICKENSNNTININDLKYGKISNKNLYQQNKENLILNDKMKLFESDFISRKISYDYNEKCNNNNNKNELIEDLKIKDHKIESKIYNRNVSHDDNNNNNKIKIESSKSIVNIKTLKSLEKINECDNIHFDNKLTIDSNIEKDISSEKNNHLISNNKISVNKEKNLICQQNKLDEIKEESLTAENNIYSELKTKNNFSIRNDLINHTKFPQEEKKNFSKNLNNYLQEKLSFLKNGNYNAPFKTENKVKPSVNDSIIIKLEEIHNNSLPIILNPLENYINEGNNDNKINFDLNLKNENDNSILSKNDKYDNNRFIQENNLIHFPSEKDDYQEFCEYVMRDNNENNSLEFSVSNLKYTDLLINSVENFSELTESNLYLYNQNKNNIIDKPQLLQIEINNKLQIINNEINKDENKNSNKEYIIENNFFEIKNYFESLDQDYNANKDNEEYLSTYFPKFYLEYKNNQMKNEKLIKENEQKDKNIEKLLYSVEEKKITVENYSKSYKDLLNELDNQEIIRKRLHNYIQLLRGNIRVYVRVKPFIHVNIT